MFDEAIQYILDKEGRDKITDDANDPGGLTKWGISLRACPSLGRDGIRNLTEQDAITIYLRDYWTVLHCDEFNPAIGLMLLDIAVNQGQPSAAIILQKALSVKQDGIVGPATVAASKKVDTTKLLHDIATSRIMRYTETKNWAVNGHGWIARTVETLIKATQLV